MSKFGKWSYEELLETHWEKPKNYLLCYFCNINRCAELKKLNGTNLFLRTHKKIKKEKSVVPWSNLLNSPEEMTFKSFRQFFCYFSSYLKLPVPLFLHLSDTIYWLIVEVLKFFWITSSFPNLLSLKKW